MSSRFLEWCFWLSRAVLRVDFGDRLSSDVGVNTKSIEVRLELWAANWQMFLSQPYLGVGPGQNLFQLGEVYAQADVEHGVIDRAHNNVLEHLAAMGIFVASLYLIVSGYFLWAAYCLSARLNTDLLRGQSARGASSHRSTFIFWGWWTATFSTKRSKIASSGFGR